AHANAYSEAKILHRAITPSSIRIDEKGRGRLTNWDQSIYWEEVRMLTSALSKHTWQFISANQQLNPNSRPHLLCDDLESIVLILIYYALRYLP
ncbi:hypothetical protein PENSPDRAFT_554532, partial [Peniophora sp. CONT]